MNRKETMNNKSVWKNMVFLLLGCLIIFSSCNDEKFVVNNAEGTFSFSVVSPQLTNVNSATSRALTTEQEIKIYSLYFFVIDSNGSILNMKNYKNGSFDSSMEKDSISEYGGNTYYQIAGPFNLNITASQKIFAIANAEYTENSYNAEDIQRQMNEATNLYQLQKIIAAYADGEENYNRPQGHMLMSGVLIEPSETNNKIYLNHNDARVRFNIELTDDAFQNGANFIPTSYKIVNLPKKSYLFDHLKNETNPSGEYTCESLVGENNACLWDASGVDNSNDYFNSSEETYFTKNWKSLPVNGVSKNKTISSFDFYTLENRKTALRSTNDNYHNRDKKTSDGNFEYAPEYATYVIIKGTYEKTNQELSSDKATGQALNSGGVTTIPSNVERVVDVEYTVHLGNFDKDNNPTDASTDNFFVDRNTSYTYNIKIINAHSIAVEAISENETVASAEGTVTDAYKTYANIDAHFGNVLMTIKIPAREVDGSDPFFDETERCLSAITPYKNGAPDYSWLQFALNTDNGTTLLSYKDAKEKLISAAKIADYIRDLRDNNGSYKAGDELNFTVFIDEFYPQTGYYKRPDDYNTYFMDSYGPTVKSICRGMEYNGQPVTGEDPIDADGNLWKTYIEAANRSFRLFNHPYTSPDNHSYYSLSQVMLTQRSIQTFYNITNSPSALGVEHTDEPGFVPYGNFSKATSNDGLTNSFGSGLTGKLWSECLDQTKLSTGSQLQTASSLYSFLQRNRDLNADGTITADEIRWYEPAIDQMVSISMAAQALLTPLYDLALPDESPDGFPRQGLTRHHLSSSNRLLWTEEIVSTGNGSGNTAYNRCVRNLGIPQSQTTPIDYYNYNNGTRTVTFPYYKSVALRAPVASGELTPMTEWDTSDRLPRYGFQIANADCDNKRICMQMLDKGLGYEGSANSPLPCADYYEETDGSDKGKWRVPNALETGLISIIVNGEKGLSYTKRGYIINTKFSWAFKDKDGNIKEKPTDVWCYGKGASSGLVGSLHHVLHYTGGGTITLNDSGYDAAYFYVRCVRDIQKP